MQMIACLSTIKLQAFPRKLLLSANIIIHLTGDQLRVLVVLKLPILEIKFSKFLEDHRQMVIALCVKY